MTKICHNFKLIPIPPLKQMIIKAREKHINKMSEKLGNPRTLSKLY